MPVSITLTLNDEGIAALANALGVAIANGGGQPALTPAADPKPPKAAAKTPAKEEKAAEPPAEQESEQEAPTTDLATDEQLAAVKEAADGADLNDVRTSLIDFYTGQGYDKKEAQKLVADMDEDSLRSYYADYLARLLVDETGEYCTDYETPYIATRNDDGKAVKHWVKGGVTMTAEEVKEAGLEDPAAPPKEEKKKKAPPLPKRGKK